MILLVFDYIRAYPGKKSLGVCRRDRLMGLSMENDEGVPCCLSGFVGWEMVDG